MARNSARDRFRVDDGKSGRRRRPERGEDADRRFHLLDGEARDDGAVERMDICHMWVAKSGRSNESGDTVEFVCRYSAGAALSQGTPYKWRVKRFGGASHHRRKLVSRVTTDEWLRWDKLG